MSWVNDIMTNVFGYTKPEDAHSQANTQWDYNQQAGNYTLHQNAEAAGKTGPFGSSQYGFDANGNPTGVTTSIDPSLGAAATGHNLGLLASQLPGTQIDFSSTMPGQVAAQGVNALYQNQAPLMQQQLNTAITDMTNRGLPVGSQAWDTNLGNIVRAQNAGISSGVAGIYNAVPQNSAILANTAQMEGMSPYTQMSGNLGLLQGFKNLVDTAGPVSYNYAPANYMQASQANTTANNNMASNFWSGVGSLGSAAMNFMFPGAGTLASGLFSSAVPSYGQTTAWSPSQFQAAWNNSTPGTVGGYGTGGYQ